MILIDYKCKKCGKEWTLRRVEEDYVSGGEFYDGAYYGDDGATRTCPTCLGDLEETGRRYED